MYSIKMYIYMANENDMDGFKPEFTDYVYRQYKITDTDCICRRCERTFKRSFLKFKAGEPDEASDAKRACTDNDKYKEKGSI
jgi:hypothetical protein